MRITALFLLSYLAFGQTRWIPHVTRSNGGFETLIIVTGNTDGSQDDFSSGKLRGYREDGSQISPLGNTLIVNNTSGALPPSAHFSSSSSQLSHFIIEGPSDGHVQVAYQKKGGGIRASAFEVTPSKGWRVFLSSEQYGWDGIAVVNAGNSTADILIELRSGGGDVISDFTLRDVRRYEKKLVVLSDYFNGVINDYVTVSSESDLVLTALRGDHQNTVLAPSPALPYTPAPKGGNGQTNQYTSKVELLKGNWFYTFKIGSSSFSENYHLWNLVYQDDPLEPPFMFGEDKYGNYDTAGSFVPSQGLWAVLDVGITLDRFYVYYTNGISVQDPACYYQISPSGSTNLSSCYFLSGYKTQVKAMIHPKANELEDEKAQGIGIEYGEMPEHLRSIYDDLKFRIESRQ